MKFTAILLLFFTTQLWSKSTTIKGFVDDSAYTSVILTPLLNTKLLDAKKEFHPKAGQFEFIVSIVEPAMYKLNYRNQSITLFLSPESTSEVHLDMKSTEPKTSFSGQNAKENNYLNSKTLATLTSKPYRELYAQRALLGVDNYAFTIDSLHSILSKQLKKNATELGLSPQFVRYYQFNNLDMVRYQLRLGYPRFLKINSDSFLQSNATFLKQFDEIPNSSSYLNYPNYIETHLLLLKIATTTHDFKNVNTDTLESKVEFKQLISNAKQYPVVSLRSILVESLLGEYISYYGMPKDLKEELNDYVNTLEDAEKTTQVKKKLLALAAYDHGKSAPLFSFVDNSGNVRKLQEFVGKVIYIDVWASWCGPCKAEIPYSKELIEHYKDRDDLVFLYISIDENKANWEKALLEHKLYKGIQGIVHPYGFNSDFAKNYRVQAIPQYILIDKSGNLIELKAYKPSQKEKIINQLNSALGVK